MVDVINGNVEKAMRDVSRMLQINGVISEVRSRTHYVKPCQERSLKKAKRIANIRKYASPKTQKRNSRSSVSIFSANII